MKLLKTTLFTFLLLITVASCSKDDLENETADFTIDLALAEQNDTQFAKNVLVLVNQHRATLGIDAILLGTQFSTAYAVDHTNYMIDISQINHDNFGIRTAAMRSVGANEVGENVAYGYNTAEAVVNAWLNSTSHRANIEGNFSHSGFGIKLCEQTNTYYFTQLFYNI